jgi:hypothetical protein
MSDGTVIILLLIGFFVVAPTVVNVWFLARRSFEYSRGRRTYFYTYAFAILWRGLAVIAARLLLTYLLWTIAPVEHPMVCMIYSSGALLPECVRLYNHLVSLILEFAMPAHGYWNDLRREYIAVLPRWTLRSMLVVSGVSPEPRS